MFDSYWGKIKNNIMMNEDEARILFEYAAKVSENGFIVEIGTLKGGSAFIMANATKGTVITIDNYSTENSNRGNVRLNLRDCENVRTVQGNSVNIAHFWDKPIDLLFIDGDHKYQNVKNDIKAWLPKIKKEGIICFHDYKSHIGVTQAVDEILNKKLEKISLTNSLLITKKI